MITIYKMNHRICSLKTKKRDRYFDDVLQIIYKFSFYMLKNI